MELDLTLLLSCFDAEHHDEVLAMVERAGRRGWWGIEVHPLVDGNPHPHDLCGWNAKGCYRFLPRVTG